MKPTLTLVRRVGACALLAFVSHVSTTLMAASGFPGTVSRLANIAVFDFEGELFEGDSRPAGFVQLHDQILFRATDIFGDTELYTYDGKTVQLLADINPGFDGNFLPKSSRPSSFTAFGNEVVFTADDGVTGRELWSYDGRQVRRVADINPLVENGVTKSSLAENVAFVQFRNELVFVANDGTHGQELWAYDGRQVRMIAEINAGGTAASPAGSNIGGLVVFGNELVFRADDGITGSELWAYDGKSVRQVANINQLPRSPSGDRASNPGSFVVFQNKLYFGATDGIHGAELWTYDGSSVQMVPELRVGSGSTFSGISGFIGVVFGNELIFSATNGITGEELWSFDGVQYRLLADINPTLVNGINQPSTVAGFTIFGGELIFAADDGLHGREVWSYNGTQVRMVADLNRVPLSNGKTGSSTPLLFTVLGNHLLFQANDGTSGTELWSYDHFNVAQVADIHPTASSTPQGLMVFGNELLFSANDGVTGIELWRLVLGQAGEQP